uniref:Uncharacterized protein n=1 Tax=Peronospora matthiolae TaxID=2874970 RepID=A0AAV1TCT2_9STRA
MSGWNRRFHRIILLQSAEKGRRRWEGRGIQKFVGSIKDQVESIPWKVPWFLTYPGQRPIGRQSSEQTKDDSCAREVE